MLPQWSFRQRRTGADEVSISLPGSEEQTEAQHEAEKRDEFPVMQHLIQQVKNRQQKQRQTGGMRDKGKVQNVPRT
jgi:hypothetical protein